MFRPTSLVHLKSREYPYAAGLLDTVWVTKRQRVDSIATSEIWRDGISMAGHTKLGQFQFVELPLIHDITSLLPNAIPHHTLTVVYHITAFWTWFQASNTKIPRCQCLFYLGMT